MQRIGSVCSIWMATGAVLAAALLGIAGAAQASATIDLIWADTGTNEIGGLGSSSVITLQVILTAGPDGSQGAGVSLDYSDAVGTLSVIGFASTAGGPLPVTLGVTSDTGSRVENINSGALPPYVGSGLTAEGQSHQLGTVTFQLIQPVAGTLEIRSDANSATDGVLNLDGDTITSITTFNSAFICSGAGPCTTPGATPTATATPTTGATPTATATPTTAATPTATAIPTPTATATASATPTNTPTPTAVPSPTPSATPTAPPLSCSEIWPEITFVTLGKGQSPSNNPKLTHSIRAHIVDPSSLRETAHRIPVCAGTEVAVAIADTTGTPTNTALDSLVCSSSGCSGVVNETEKYNSTSADGKDKDSITFLPK